jgi:hypothetical protein
MKNRTTLDYASHQKEHWSCEAWLLGSWHTDGVRANWGRTFRGLIEQATEEPGKALTIQGYHETHHVRILRTSIHVDTR